jgi:hypothetical protein
VCKQNTTLISIIEPAAGLDVWPGAPGLAAFAGPGRYVKPQNYFLRSPPLNTHSPCI